MATQKWNADFRRWEDDRPAPEPSQELRAKRIKWARILLANALDATSERLAERLIQRWGLNIIEIGGK